MFKMLVRVYVGDEAYIVSSSSLSCDGPHNFPVILKLGHPTNLAPNN
jgi:hypothetical protein